MLRILMLGGYGGVGQRMARCVLRQTDCSVVLAGRDEAQAAALAGVLNEEFQGGRVSATTADAANAASLETAFRGVDLVMVCSRTAPYAEQVAGVALARGIDYLDIHYAPRVPLVLGGLAAAAKEAGRCLITQAGFHPGLLAPLTRLAVSRLPDCRKVAIGLTMSIRRVESANALSELLDELGDYQAHRFEGGHWRPAGWPDRRPFDFGPSFGRRVCVPIDFAEMQRLPESCGLSELGCYVSGFNWLVDYLVLPVAILRGKVRKGPAPCWLGRWLVWGVNTFSREPFGVVFLLEAEGDPIRHPGSLRIRLYHEDPYEITAIPVVACLKQYLDGSIRRPGLWLMGEVADAERLFRDMETMGVHLEVSRASNDAEGPSLQQALSG